MAEREMYATTDLVPLLKERGIELHPTQVYRLVTQRPERLSVKVLLALIDILGCAMEELIEPVTATTTAAQKRVGERVPASGRAIKPIRAQIAPAPKGR
ncbi:MAG: helix-turn-helix domain-containing protein [Actinomycetota bacterium]